MTRTTRLRMQMRERKGAWLHIEMVCQRILRRIGKTRSGCDVKEELDDGQSDKGLLNEKPDASDPLCMRPPSPWVLVYDYNTRQFYYWHPVIMKSSWDPPPGSRPVSTHSHQAPT